MPKIYALYKGETYLESGSLVHLAKQRKVKLESMRFMTSKAYKKRVASAKHTRGGMLELVLIESE